MAKTTPLGVRVNEQLKEALDRAAQADMRSTASLVNKILTEWVVLNEFLQQSEVVSNSPSKPRLSHGGRFRRPLGRPIIPPPSTPHERWQNDKVAEIVRGREFITIEELCKSVTGFDLAVARSGTATFQSHDRTTCSPKPHVERALANSLIRAGFVKAIDTETEEEGWVNASEFLDR